MASFRVSSHLSRVSPGTVLLYTSVSVGEHLGILPCPGLAHVCHQLENLLTNKKKKAYPWSTKHEKCMFVRLLLGNFVMQADSSGKQGRAGGHHCYDLDIFFHPVWNCLSCLRGWKGYSSDFKVFCEDLWERLKKEICQNWAWILGLMWVKLHRNQKAPSLLGMSQ